MRFLVVGLALIFLGIGASEWQRRHSSDDPKGSAKKVKNAPVAPPGMSELIATVAPAAEAAASLEPMGADLVSMATSAGDAVAGFTPVMRGAFKVRELRPVSDGVAFLFEKSGQIALVHWPSSGAPSVLTVRSTPPSSLSFDPKSGRLVWGEGGMVKSISEKGGEVKTLIAFERALVTSAASSGERTIAALVPREGDPFASDPNGAVVLIENGTVKLIAQEQVRPREVVFDGTDDAFFIAGYPSGLTRAALDGSFTARIADRADGPVVLESDGITFRYPQASSPELRRGARAGGSVKTLARVDVEWLAVRGGIARYTTTGIAPRLYEAGSEEANTELGAIKGAVKGLAWSSDALWLATMDEAGLVTLQVKR